MWQNETSTVSILECNLLLNHVLASVPHRPEPGLVGQLTLRSIPGLLLSGQVDELQILFIYICLPAKFLSAEPASQGQGCVIATT